MRFHWDWSEEKQRVWRETRKRKRNFSDERIEKKRKKDRENAFENGDEEIFLDEWRKKERERERDSLVVA
jgi:hypothetical protein